MLDISQLCLSAAGIICWYDNVRIVGKLDQLVVWHHWLEVSSVDDVCGRTNARALNYASRYWFECRCLTLIPRAVCVPTEEIVQPVVDSVWHVKSG